MRNLNISWFTLLSLEQPKLPVRFKDGDAVEVIEKQEVASTTQVILFSRWNLASCASTQTIQNFSLEVVFFDKIFKNSLHEYHKFPSHPPPCNFFIGFLLVNVLLTIQCLPCAFFIHPPTSILLHLQARQAESNVNQTENRTFPPLECINTATTTVGGGHLCGILPPEKVRKVWTCVICQVTAQSETALISHLHGKRHKATREQLKGKKHRASLQALDGLGGNRHAWVTEYVHTTIAEDVVLISRPRWPWSSKVPVD